MAQKEGKRAKEKQPFGRGGSEETSACLAGNDRLPRPIGQRTKSRRGPGRRSRRKGPHPGAVGMSLGAPRLRIIAIRPGIDLQFHPASKTTRQGSPRDRKNPATDSSSLRRRADTRLTPPSSRTSKCETACKDPVQPTTSGPPPLSSNSSFIHRHRR